MMNSSIRLGKIFGIEVGINFTLIFIAVLVTSQLARIDLPHRAPGYNDFTYMLFGAIGAILFFASILWHELAHAIFAQYYKIRVKRIVLFFLGGIAEMESEPKKAYQEFWIAIAGPISSAILGGIFLGLGRAFFTDTILGAIFFWLGIINLSLAIFNMIPGFPLDGGRVLRSIVWWLTGNFMRATRFASYLGQAFAYLTILGSLMMVFSSAMWSSALWSLFLGFFLLNAAKSHLQVAAVRESLSGIPIRYLVNERAYAEADWPLAYALDRIAAYGPVSAMPVTRMGEWVGVLTVENIRVWPRLHWGNITVAQAMTPLTHFQTVDADNDLYETLQNETFRQQPYLLVKSDEKLIGLLSHREIVSFAEKQLRSV